MVLGTMSLGRISRILIQGHRIRFETEQLSVSPNKLMNMY